MWVRVYPLPALAVNNLQYAFQAVPLVSVWVQLTQKLPYDESVLMLSYIQPAESFAPAPVFTVVALAWYGGMFAFGLFAECALADVLDGDLGEIPVFLLMAVPVAAVAGAILGSVPAGLLVTLLWLLGRQSWEAAHWSAWAATGIAVGLAFDWLAAQGPDETLWLILILPFPAAGAAAALAFRAVMRGTFPCRVTLGPRREILRAGA